MKAKSFPLVCALLFLGTASHLSKAFGQGSLTPPGAPAATMKTLQQVEPRIPISTLPVTLNTPGSYYLTTNLSGVAGLNGITINVNNITIDLMGFTVTGVPGSASGVLVSGQLTNLSVRNGIIANWGSRGINGGSSHNSAFEDLRISHNAFGGLIAGEGSRVRDCQLERNGGDGLTAGDGSVIKQCLVRDGSGDAIVAGSRCQVTGNTIEGSTGAGIRILAAARDALVEANLVVSNAVGLAVDGTGNSVQQNTVKRNADNYTFAAGNLINLLLCEVPEPIDWPAAVLLAGTFTGVAGADGITVSANDVTIDLGGHSLIGVPGSLDGIKFTGTRTNISVRNGSVSDWGEDGVDAMDNGFGLGSFSGEFVSLKLSRNGATNNLGAGLRAGRNALVRHCTATRQVAGPGFLVREGSTVSDCTANDNGADGFLVFRGCRVANCLARGNGGGGINGSDESTVSGCTVSRNGGDGIVVSGDSQVTQNMCSFNVGAGIYVVSQRNRIDSNHVTQNGRGIHVTGGSSTANIITRNTAGGNGIEYDIVAGNFVGTISNNPTTANAWANFDH